jgi:hypothetical protein
MKRVSAADVDTAAVFQLHMLWALTWHEWEDVVRLQRTDMNVLLWNLHAVATDN